MGNEIYKQHVFSFYMFLCVDVVVHFVMGLVTMIHNKNIYRSTNHSISSFVCIPYINAFFIHKNSWSCLLPRFWNLVTKIKSEIYPKKE
jgi:hypothetical protein